MEYRPENRVPDLRLKNGLGDGDAAADELSGISVYFNRAQTLVKFLSLWSLSLFRYSNNL